MPSLCIQCAHVRIIQNQRGSTFYLCGRSSEDARYAKYPPQPVWRCPGYVPQQIPPQESDQKA